MKIKKQIKNDKCFYLKDIEIKKINSLKKHYPNNKAAIIESLKIVQKHRNWVSDDAIQGISKILDISSSEIESIATFYNQIFRKPVGRNVIRICDSFVCFILGYEKIKTKIIKHLKIKYGQITIDHRFTLLPTCCLGACDKGPVIMINEDTYYNVEYDSLVKILEKYR